MARVTYDGNGYTEGSVPVDTHEYTSMDTVIVADPGTMKCDGAIFSHWESSLNHGSYSPKQRMRITKSVTMRAVWSPLCAVIYNVSTAASVSGDIPIDAGLHRIGDVVAVPTHGLITAYIALVKQEDNHYDLEGMVTCLGWRILTGGKAGKDVLVSGDTFEITDSLVVLQPVWGTPDITVAYESGNITGADIPPQSAQQFRPVTIAALPEGTTRPGYKFVEWKDSASGITYLPGEEAVFTSSKVLVAVWYPDTTCTVTYDLNGGSGPTPEPQTIGYGEYVTLPETTPVRGGYTFGGWIVPFADRTSVYESNETIQITSNVTIVARWVPMDTSKVFSLTYQSTEPDLIADAEPPTDNTVYVSGDYAFVQAWFPAKHGRHVSGWTDAAGNVYKFGSHVQFAQSSVVLTAVWDDDTTVTLTFHSMVPDASGSVNDIITSGTYTVQLPPASSFTRDGYFAAGWVRIVDGIPTDERYDSGEYYRVPETDDDNNAEVQFGVEWIDTNTVHTVKYEDTLREFGHLPVDPCKYHAGELIPLPPVGDLRYTGYRMAGWVDVKNQKFYRIPTKSEFEKLISGDTPHDYNRLTTYVACRGDHVFRALWIPTLTLYFGGVGSTGGTPPAPVELVAGESYYLPECGTLTKTGYKFCGWQRPSDSTNRVYHAGSKFVYTGEPDIILQPVWKAANIVEYVIPPELAIVNTSWAPKSKYVFDHKPFHVDVPPEMAGRYVWMRSDNGETIADPCDIEIDGDLALTLIPYSINDTSDYPMCIQRIDYGDRLYEGKRFWSDPVRIGDNLTLSSQPGLKYWVADNNPSRVYAAGQGFPIYGNTTFRPVFEDGNDANDEYHVVYVMPEGANAEAPVDDTNYTAGEFATAPPHHGTRGPNGTNLLYWYAVDADDNDLIVTRYYPNEKIYIPNPADPVYGKIVNPATKVVTLHPMFGDKFTLKFTDTTGNIMPRISPANPAEYAYSTPVAEDQMIRIPKIVGLERDARSYADWVNAWEYPSQGTSNTTKATVYAGSFDDIVAPHSNIILEVVILGLGSWLVVRFIRNRLQSLWGTVEAKLRVEKSPISSTVNFQLGTTKSDDDMKWKEAPPDPLTLLWWEDATLPDPKKLVTTTCVEPLGWRIAGEPNGRIYYAGDMVKGGSVSPVVYEIVWDCPIDVWYLLNSTKRDEADSANIRDWYAPVWNGAAGRKRKCQRIHYTSDVTLDPPLFGRDFNVASNRRAEMGNDLLDSSELYMICDRWLPRRYPEDAEEDDELVVHPALRDYAQDLAADEIWLWARNEVSGYSDVNKMVRIEEPDINYDEYFDLAPLSDEETATRTSTYIMIYDLRWAPVVEIRYTYKVNTSHILYKTRTLTTDSFKPNYVGSTPRLEYERELGGHLRNFKRYLPPVGQYGGIGFIGWDPKPNSNTYRYYDQMYKLGYTKLNPDLYWSSGTLLPSIRIDSPSVIELVAKYIPAKFETGEYETEPIKVDANPKHRSKDFDMSLVQGNVLIDKSDKESQRAARKGDGSQNQNSARIEALTMMCVGERIDPSIAYDNCKIAGTMYKIRDAFRGPSAFITFDYDTGTATIDEKDTGESEKIREDSDKTIDPDREPGGKLKPDDHASGEPVPKPKGINWWKYIKRGIEVGLIILEVCKLVTGTSGKSNIHDYMDVANNLFGDSVTAANHSGKRLRAPSYADVTYRNINAEMRQYVRDLRDGAVLTSGMDPSRISLKSVYKLMDADTDMTANAKRIEPGWIETMKVKTITGPDGNGSIPVIDYIPRDPTKDDVYFVGDSVTVPEGKHLCRVDYLTFANTYDDYIIGYTNKEKRTYDGTFLEPHEYHTVLDCAVPMESRPKGKVFAGWIVDDSTKTIAQPGDRIKQGLGSHNFRAVWVDENPTLWGDA